MGLSGADGELPWAALQARKTEGAWAFVSPCHWQIGALHVAMHHAPLPQFEAAESKALLAAMQPYFAEDGITLYYDQAQRWLAQGEVFRGLASASLDRVAGRQLDPWMPKAAQASGLRRLQSEMQMLLYTHPVNSARSQRGLLPVNSFGSAAPAPCLYCRKQPMPAPGAWWWQTNCARLRWPKTGQPGPRPGRRWTPATARPCWPPCTKPARPG